MPSPLRLTREQADRLTEKLVEKILCDEEGADGILQLLDRAVIIEEA